MHSCRDSKPRRVQLLAVPSGTASRPASLAVRQAVRHRRASRLCALERSSRSRQCRNRAGFRQPGQRVVRGDLLRARALRRRRSRRNGFRRATASARSCGQWCRAIDAAFRARRRSFGPSARRAGTLHAPRLRQDRGGGRSASLYRSCDPPPGRRSRARPNGRLVRNARERQPAGRRGRCRAAAWRSVTRPLPFETAFLPDFASCRPYSAAATFGCRRILDFFNGGCIRRRVRPVVAARPSFEGRANREHSMTHTKAHRLMLAALAATRMRRHRRQGGKSRGTARREHHRHRRYRHQKGRQGDVDHRPVRFPRRYRRAAGRQHALRRWWMTEPSSPSPWTARRR